MYWQDCVDIYEHFHLKQMCMWKSCKRDVSYTDICCKKGLYKIPQKCPNIILIILMKKGIRANMFVCNI